VPSGAGKLLAKAVSWTVQQRPKKLLIWFGDPYVLFFDKKLSDYSDSDAPFQVADCS